MKKIIGSKFMVNLSVPVIRALSLQDVDDCHHHWLPKSGLDFFPPNLTFLFFSPSSSLQGSYVVIEPSTLLYKVLT